MWPDRRFFGVFLEHQKTKKNTFFEKRTGEVIENKASGPKSEPERPKSEPEKLLKTRPCGKNEPKTNRRRTWRIVGPDLARQWQFARLSTLESELARGDPPESTQSRI